MPDKLFMPTHPSSPFSHAYTCTHHQPDSSPPGLAKWACYIKASAYGSRVGWTPAQTIRTYVQSQRSEIGCLSYFHMWCGLSANLECMSEMCCTRLTENTGRKKSSLWHHRTSLSGCIFTAEACQLEGVSQTAALNRGHHLNLAGRPSRWALAHILVMVALCNRADHCIFILFLSFFFFLFFPRLISAVGDWMFTILWHMVWP